MEVGELILVVNSLVDAMMSRCLSVGEVLVSLRHYVSKVNGISLEGYGHDHYWIWIFLVLHVGFCTQALEHSIIDHKATPMEQVARVEEAQAIIIEGWALAELEQSVAKVAHQVLEQELDSLSARNEELEGD